VAEALQVGPVPENATETVLAPVAGPNLYHKLRRQEFALKSLLLPIKVKAAPA